MTLEKKFKKLYKIDAQSHKKSKIKNVKRRALFFPHYWQHIKFLQKLFFKSLVIVFMGATISLMVLNTVLADAKRG